MVLQQKLFYILYIYFIKYIKRNVKKNNYWNSNTPFTYISESALSKTSTFNSEEKEKVAEHNEVIQVISQI